MRRKLAYILVESSRFTSDEDLARVLVLLNNTLTSLRRDPFALEDLYISLIIYGAQPNRILPLTSLVGVIDFSDNIEPGFGCMLGKTLKFLNDIMNSELIPKTYENRGDWWPSVLIITSGNSDDDIDLVEKRHHFSPVIVVGVNQSNVNGVRSFQEMLSVQESEYRGSLPISGQIRIGAEELVSLTMDAVLGDPRILPRLLMEKIVS